MPSRLWAAAPRSTNPGISSTTSPSTARYCDLCIIMKKGELVVVGDPKKVITEKLIEDVYEVSSSVGLDRDGELYILPKKYIGSDAF